MTTLILQRSVRGGANGTVSEAAGAGGAEGCGLQEDSDRLLQSRPCVPQARPSCRPPFLVCWVPVPGSVIRGWNYSGNVSGEGLGRKRNGQPPVPGRYRYAWLLTLGGS